MNHFNNQVLALAGVFQSALMVEQLARQGSLERPRLEQCIRTILNLNPNSVEEIYGGASGVQSGLVGLKEVLAKRGKGMSPDVLRYAMGLLHAQRKLMARDDLMETLSQHLTRAVEQCRYFDDPLHESVIAAVANSYQQSVSKLDFRIRVMGNPSYLQNPNIAEQVRTVLLFGIRSAHLWHQQGGRRWHIVVKRSKLHDTAEHLLKGL
ncbi:high frequency lysogenization protein HflD [Saccharospirillum impatiens]|uniref:high frequency lysogenization protein HflD n=1 Tax=Saccharospirillum impatiens TaxID=169438 RepID=UPI0004101305|nr:high frequency lysogenization protein HflD [Saccharospirillum impatiens]